MFNKITLQNVPGLIELLGQHEDPAELLKMSPEQILLRWFNYQLEKAGSNRRVNNFGKDIKDSEAYTILINQIAPKSSGVSKLPLQQSDLTERAEGMLKEADKIGCRYLNCLTSSGNVPDLRDSLQVICYSL